VKPNFDILEVDINIVDRMQTSLSLVSRDIV